MTPNTALDTTLHTALNTNGAVTAKTANTTGEAMDAVTETMSEKEAAQYLDLNPQTLYRYRKSGKLAFRLVPGKTRPTIAYERADVEALKQELEQQRAHSPKPSPLPSSQMRRVSFGLPPGGYQELAAEAAQYEMGVGEYARRLMREGLESQFRSEAAELRGELKSLARQIDQVREETRHNRAALQDQQVSETQAKSREAEGSGAEGVAENARAIAALRTTVEEMEKSLGVIGAEVQSAQREVAARFNGFADGLEAILEFTGLSPAEAKQWVNDNLR